ncbi:hypothetical protein Poly24_53760 [Rosistilla carotiformis]|uniref:Uncharacterized protein n=1 Tax=Rosistilla carotiformis TaxID=2528017 RepID=A0A518K1J3_9BACT|nr:hypothetical protein [Rosistilla carotiformis]QDV71637.1 hypothetical protein Poly24_53760 [Rosistilla carotiformis]
MQMSRLTGTIAVTGPLLFMVTAIELLSAWSGDSAFASCFGAIRIAMLVVLVIALTQRSS